MRYFQGYGYKKVEVAVRKGRHEYVGHIARMLISPREGGGPLTELELKRLESDLRIRLPVDYRRFLLRFNGGRPEPAEFDLESDGEVVPWRLHIFFSVNDAIDSCRIDWNYRVLLQDLPADLRVLNEAYRS